MAKPVFNGTENAAFPLPAYAGPDAAADQAAAQIAAVVAGAIAGLRRDVEKYHPSRPAIAYALAGETHAATVQQWRQYPAEAQIALLMGFLEEASALLRQLQACAARLVPANGYMYGLQDEAMKLEAQAEITVEEIHRIKAELRALNREDAAET